MDSLSDCLDRFIEFTAWEMTKPKAYGPFHLIFTFAGVSLLLLLAWKLRNISERGNRILLISVSSFLIITEVYKQLFLLFSYRKRRVQLRYFPLSPL